MTRLTGYGHVRGIALDDYTPMVLQIARRKLGTAPKHLAGLDDLFQAGMIGLLEAAERFDAGRGAKFSTFAYYYAFGHMERLLAPARRLPDARGEGELLELVLLVPARDAPDENATDTVSRLLDAHLTGRHRAVARARWLDGATQSSIGSELGVTRQRVQQLEAEIIGRLRSRCAVGRRDEAGSWRPAPSITARLRARGIELGPRHMAGAA